MQCADMPDSPNNFKMNRQTANLLQMIGDSNLFELPDNLTIVSMLGLADFDALRAHSNAQRPEYAEENPSYWACSSTARSSSSRPCSRCRARWA